MESYNFGSEIKILIFFQVRHQGIQKMDQRKFKDRPHVLDLSYGVFWDEYKTIEEECGANHKEAGPHLNGHKETNGM